MAWRTFLHFRGLYVVGNRMGVSKCCQGLVALYIHGIMPFIHTYIAHSSVCSSIGHRIMMDRSKRVVVVVVVFLIIGTRSVNKEKFKAGCIQI